MHGSHKAGSTAAIRLPIGYRRLNPTYTELNRHTPMDCITHGPHQAWTAQRMVSRPQSRIKPQLRPRGSQRMDRIKYVISDIFCEKGFFKQVFKFTKTGRFVSWMFCNLDVL